jgi:hypothetical protein
MAPFGGNVQPDDPSVTQYLGFFKSPQAPMPNEAGAILGKTIATGIEQAGQAYDQYNKTSIDSAAHSAIDPIMEERNQTLTQMINVAEKGTLSDAQGNPVPITEDLLKNPQNAPAGLQNLDKIVSNLRQGRDHGVFDDTYYKMQMDNLAKQMRSQYPGYRDYIDGRIKEAEGSTANQLAQSLIQKFNDLMGQKDKEKEHTSNYADQHSDLPGIAEKKLEWQHGQRSTDQLMLDIAHQRSIKTEAERAETGIRLQEGNEKLQKQTLTPAVNLGIGNASDTSWNTLLPNTDPRWNTPEKAAQFQIAVKLGNGYDAQGNKVSQMELNSAAAAVQAGYDRYLTGADKELNTVLANGKRKRDVVGEEEAQKMVTARSAIWNARIKAATEGDASTLKFLDNQNKAITATDQNNIYSDPDVGKQIRSLAAIRQAVGDPGVMKVFDNLWSDPKLGPGLIRFTGDKMSDMALQPPDRHTTLDGNISAAKSKVDGTPGTPQEHKDKISSMTQHFIANSMTMMTNPNNSPEARTIKFNLAAAVFGPGNENVFRQFADDRFDNNGRYYAGKNYIFSGYGSQEMVDTMRNLGKEDAHTFSQYENTMKNWAGKFILPSAISSLQDENVRKQMNIAWSPEQGHFVYGIAPPGGEQGASFNPRLASAASTKLGQTMTLINRTMDVFKRIAVAKGEDPAEYVTTMLHSFGYNDAKPETLPSEMFKAMLTSHTFESRFDAATKFQQLEEAKKKKPGQ